ncbi:gamma-glutamylcyclotransferase [Neptunicella sp. SCSIO 80796]|uniref:gamma-glutamylcyclotransferase n=1 Tax=Neptunicella plasticusilytica TaxID=3117012 RepID=UPI003A4D6856
MLFSDTDEFILGYGSLLSHDSRWRFSAINTAVIPVSVQGWQRSWITRNIEEQQSHVGALPKQNASLNGVLVPTERITDRLRQREKDYLFAPVPLCRLTLQVDRPQINALKQQLQHRKIWICQSLGIHPANKQFPVMQSYVDTCLAGCLENGGEDFARAFVKNTAGWNEGWINDRKMPRYPRAARVDKVLQQKIDQLLDEFELLQLRQIA